MTTGAGPGQQPATRDVFAALRRAAAAQEYHALVINGDISYARVGFLGREGVSGGFDVPVARQ